MASYMYFTNLLNSYFRWYTTIKSFVLLVSVGHATIKHLIFYLFWVVFGSCIQPSRLSRLKITLLQAVFTVCDAPTELLAISKTTADTATGTCQTEYRGKAGSQKPVAFCAQGAKQKVEDSVYVKIKKFSGLLKNLVRFGSYLLYST